MPNDLKEGTGLKMARAFINALNKEDRKAGRPEGSTLEYAVNEWTQVFNSQSLELTELE